MNAIINILKIDDLVDLPDAISTIVFGDLDIRNQFYDQLAKSYNYDFSYDWFQSMYEDELAQRKQNKQDFTPNSVGRLLSKLTGVSEGKIYEPTAGNGSILISNWHYRKAQLGEKMKPEDHKIECWELSSRSIPILLLNLSIRNISGVVCHGDVLTKECKSKFELNSTNNYSNITRHENK